VDAARIRPAFNWLPETGLFRQFQYLTVPLHHSTGQHRPAAEMIAGIIAQALGLDRPD